MDRGKRATSYQIDGRWVTVDEPVPVVSVLTKDRSCIFHDLQKVYEEATIAGIHLFCITLDKGSVDFMGKIFGNALIYPPNIAELRKRLIDIFKRVTTRSTPGEQRRLFRRRARRRSSYPDYCSERGARLSLRWRARPHIYAQRPRCPWHRSTPIYRSS